MPKAVWCIADTLLTVLFNFGLIFFMKSPLLHFNTVFMAITLLYFLEKLFYKNTRLKFAQNLTTNLGLGKRIKSQYKNKFCSKYILYKIEAISTAQLAHFILLHVCLRNGSRVREHKQNLHIAYLTNRHGIRILLFMIIN